MAGDEERLFVSLEARVTDFEKKFAQAERRGTRTYSRLRTDSARATKAMEQDMTRSAGRINQALAQGGAKMGAIGKTWAVGLVGGFAGGIAAAGLTEIVGNAARIAEGIAQIGDEAKRAGVSAKVFQEWKFVAEQNRIGVDALVDGLKELNLRADEFAITGKGSAAEAFARLGYSAEEVKEKLKDPSALLLEIIGRLELMDKAAQIRISDELFGGTAGERFVELLDQGEAGIRSTIDAANDLGVIMDDQMIAKAAEVDRQFKIIATTVGTSLKGAIVAASAALMDFISQFRSVQRQTANTLRHNRAMANADIAALQGSLAQNEADVADLKNSKDPMAQAIAPERERLLAEDRARLQAAIAQRDAIQAQMDRISPPQQFGPPKPGAKPATADGWTPPEYVPPPSSSAGSSGGGGGGGGGAAERADDFQREEEAIKRRTAALVANTLAQSQINPLLDDFGRAAETASARAELLLAAEQAEIPITDDLRAKVEALAVAYGDAAAKRDQLTEDQGAMVEQAEQMANLRRETLGGFVNDLRNGIDASEALGNALGKLADKLADMALDAIFAPKAAGGGAGGLLGLLGGGAGGAGGGLLGGLLGGVGSFLGFASGTANTGGKRGQPRGVVHGQEAVIPLPAGGKVPVKVQGSEPAPPQRTDVRVGVEVLNDGGIRAFVMEQVTKSEKRSISGSLQAVQKANRASGKFLGKR